MLAIRQAFPILRRLSQKDWQTIKDWDRRIVPLEKHAIMARPQPWSYDQFFPLADVRIECLSPKEAYDRFLDLHTDITHAIAERGSNA